MRTIAEDVEKEDWKDYAIRLHAYKGVMAIIGQKEISDWALKLEMAGKSAALTAGAEAALSTASAVTLIKGATAPVCEMLKSFRDALLATPLIPNDDSNEKTKITAAELTEQLKALESACAAFKATDANKIVSFLETVSVDEVTDTALTEICRLVAALDYDEAVAAIATQLAMSREQ
jgi:HPt (histidine-containing phosphotransfer) domain-containing protein